MNLDNADPEGVAIGSGGVDNDVLVVKGDPAICGFADRNTAELLISLVVDDDLLRIAGAGRTGHGDQQTEDGEHSGDSGECGSNASCCSFH